MTRSLRRRWTALLALPLLLAGCGGSDGPTEPQYTIGGTYNAVNARQTLAAGSSKITLPAVVYQGAVSDGTNTYDVRYEILAARLVMAETNSSYRFEGTYRLTFTNGERQPITETTVETGQYIHFEEDVSFIQGLESDVWMDGSGTFTNGVITVGADDPLFDENYVMEFRK